MYRDAGDQRRPPTPNTMSARQSAATERALRLVAKGWTAYAAAKKQGIALSTVYRALKRIREAEAQKK